MKKITALLIVALLMFSLAGCAGTAETSKTEDGKIEDTKSNEEDGKVKIVPDINIKGAWIVTSTPEPITMDNPSDYRDSAKLYDMTIRANINAIFPEDGIIEVFENGICSCNGLSMEYQFVAGKAVEFSAKGTGLIFKLKKDDNTLKLTLNEDYEVVLTRK